MVDTNKNYFAVLGLPPSATRIEIKKAFKELAFQYHPDRNPHNPRAEERFKETVEAYSYLTGNLEALKSDTAALEIGQEHQRLRARYPQNLV